MLNEHDSQVEQRSKYLVEEPLESIYDLSGAGMAIHSHAIGLVHNTDSIHELPKWAINSISYYRSNYLTTPYTLGYFGEKSASMPSPIHQVTHTEKHISLIRTMYDEYRGLDWSKYRETLAGEVGLYVEDPTQPISFIELPLYLQAAIDLGMLEPVAKNGKNVFEIVQNSDLTANNIINFERNLFRNGIFTTDAFVEQLRSTELSQRFREPTIRAAVHKLGAMLAITDQISYDAKESGIPISVDYKPDDASGTYNRNFLKLFGQELPSVETVISQSVDVFRKVADPDDSLVSHLFETDVTRHLSR